MYNYSINIDNMTDKKEWQKESKQKDGSSCPGCGLPNWQGLCPHCSGDQQRYEQKLVPPFQSSRSDN